MAMAENRSTNLDYTFFLGPFLVVPTSKDFMISVIFSRRDPCSHYIDKCFGQVWARFLTWVTRAQSFGAGWIYVKVRRALLDMARFRL